MSELTQEQCEFLAAEVMGWELNTPKRNYLRQTDKSHVMWEVDWRPNQNIEQAFMLLDKFNGIVEITGRAKKKGRQRWDVVLDKMFEPEYFCDSLPFAICLAVLQARGWEDE